MCLLPGTVRPDAEGFESNPNNLMLIKCEDLLVSSFYILKSHFLCLVESRLGWVRFKVEKPVWRML